jgi:uncharacterized protein YndB with AHSA1/START domain
VTTTIHKELLIPQPREQVWRGLTDSTTLAEWMFPNDFVPRIGHHFTFQVPPNPRLVFDGLARQVNAVVKLTFFRASTNEPTES